jgi:hypothetical protein
MPRGEAIWLRFAEAGANRTHWCIEHDEVHHDHGGRRANPDETCDSHERLLCVHGTGSQRGMGRLTTPLELRAPASNPLLLRLLCGAATAMLG